ncbi:hypothetical protein Tco_0534334 [Tanacetum coccineum]
MDIILVTALQFLPLAGCDSISTQDVLNKMGCDGEIDDMLRISFALEFYSTYEIDEVCADDELQTKKIVKFRLGRRAHSLTLLEFARRLGLYQEVELDEEGFNVYFEGGLRSDEHFNAQEYWLSISQTTHLQLGLDKGKVDNDEFILFWGILESKCILFYDP